MIEIRNEEERDYKKVEEVTRAAFLEFVCSWMR